MDSAKDAPMLLAPLVFALHFAMVWTLSLHVQDLSACRSVRAGHGGVIAVISFSAMTALCAMLFSNGSTSSDLWGLLLLPVLAGMVGCTGSLGLLLRLRPQRPLLPLLLCSALAHLSTSLLIYALIMPVMTTISR